MLFHFFASLSPLEWGVLVFLFVWFSF